MCIRDSSREVSRRARYDAGWDWTLVARLSLIHISAVNYLTEHGISTLDELDAALSSVSEQADTIRAGMKTAEERMKKLQKLIEYGKNYTEYKPIHDGLKKLKNGWTSKRDKYEEDVYKRQRLCRIHLSMKSLFPGQGKRQRACPPAQGKICHGR